MSQGGRRRGYQLGKDKSKEEDAWDALKNPMPALKPRLPETPMTQPSETQMSHIAETPEAPLEEALAVQPEETQVFSLTEAQVFTTVPPQGETQMIQQVEAPTVQPVETPVSPTSESQTRQSGESQAHPPTETHVSQQGEAQNVQLPVMDWDEMSRSVAIPVEAREALKSETQRARLVESLMSQPAETLVSQKTKKRSARYRPPAQKPKRGKAGQQQEAPPEGTVQITAWVPESHALWWKERNSFYNTTNSAYMREEIERGMRTDPNKDLITRIVQLKQLQARGK